MEKRLQRFSQVAILKLIVFFKRENLQIDLYKPLPNCEDKYNEIEFK
jgi:hypothetical protein